MTQEAVEQTAGASTTDAPVADSRTVDSETIDTSPGDSALFSESGPPGWLRLVALVGAAAVLSLGLAGLVLAINGWYRPALVFAIGAVLLVAVVALARPAFAKTSAPREAHVYAVVGLVAIVAITAWNTDHASQHVLINRDGGDYANTGRWIARDG